ncbi:peptidase G2 autoproteolytic cleavage domain-containing protein [Lysinibacillus sp. NPDC094177]|uniref:peptidase G2 autoproteolytic cleavage domain-containing protein n=1 Tax=Lysinibacillus sp. NPDC094177 TaxID=3390580 RepID=UPI003CFE553E
MTGSPNLINAADDAFVIGNGTSPTSRSNAFRVKFNGAAYGLSAFNSTGADYAEYFEWKDGNPRNHDRVGYVVTLDKGGIRKATAKDNYFLGIVSANPSIIGNSHQDEWAGKYITDEWGRIKYDWVKLEIPAVDDEDSATMEIKDCYVPLINPNYNPDETYKPREERPEWSPVGITGQLLVRDDGTLFSNNFAKVGKLDGELTLSEEPTNMRVMERVASNIVRVFIK